MIDYPNKKALKYAKSVLSGSDIKYEMPKTAKENANAVMRNSGKERIYKSPSGSTSGIKVKEYGGIALVFWDKGVTTWNAANDIFYPAYNWKCTFAIYGWSGFNAAQKNLALGLQDTYGHRLENHGTTFHTLSSYPDADTFFNAEVEPNRLAMEADGVNPIKVFAYSDGERTVELSKKIVDETPHQMTLTTYMGLLDSIGNSYCFDSNLWIVGDNTHGISGKAFLALDTQSEGFDIDYILMLLGHCRTNNKVLLIGGHGIYVDDSLPRRTSYNTLHTICQYIVDNNMTFYTLEDLILRFTKTNRPNNPYIKKIEYNASGGNAWEVGTKMQARGDYMDDQDRSETGKNYWWYRADDIGGANEIVIATTQNYTLVAADSGKYLRCSIQPYNAENTGYIHFPAKRHLVT